MIDALRVSKILPTRLRKPNLANAYNFYKLQQLPERDFAKISGNGQLLQNFRIEVIKIPRGYDPQVTTVGNVQLNVEIRDIICLNYLLFELCSILIFDREL